MRCHRVFLGIVALLTPCETREEWLAEWCSELWHVQKARGSWRAAAFCWGALQDALWIRRNHPPPLPSPDHLRLHSPSQCGLLLTALAALSLYIAFWRPGARKADLTPPRPSTQSLAMLSPHRYFGTQLATVSADDYQSWAIRTKNMFEGIAFYQPAWTKARSARCGTADFTIALASANLFQILGVALKPVDEPALILSEHAAAACFGLDSPGRGNTIPIAGQPARVAGVIPDGSWPLPGRIDAWLLMDRLPADAKGFVVAKLQPTVSPMRSGAQWRVSVPNEEGGIDSFYCQSLAAGVENRFAGFLMIVSIACLILPVTTSLSLGEYPSGRPNRAWRTDARRWLFLSAKFTLILLIFYSGWHCLTSYKWSGGGLLQSLLTACVLALRWMLIDQRQRCPVCLRLLSNPVRVGQASRNFLGWSGTELMCKRGHGLLYVPEFPTSWCSTQHWLYLDGSWSGLFR